MSGPDQTNWMLSLIRAIVSAARIIGYYIMYQWREKDLGPVAQSIVSLTSSLVVKILTFS